MNFPLFIKAVIIAAVIALLSYFIAGALSVTQQATAIGAFIGSLVGFISAMQFSGESTIASSEEIKTLYVGNLPYRANEAAVRHLFAEHGNVHSVRLMKDKNTGKRRGFGFVEIAAKDSNAAIKALNDTEFQQRTLKVREAKERPERTED